MEESSVREIRELSLIKHKEFNFDSIVYNTNAKEISNLHTHNTHTTHK